MTTRKKYSKEINYPVSLLRGSLFRQGVVSESWSEDYLPE